jgi:hypothetical protein
MTLGHRKAAERILMRQTGQEREARSHKARDRLVAAAKRKEPTDYLWESIRDVLWAAGCVDTLARCVGLGMVGVSALGIRGEGLRGERAVEVLAEAERILRGAGYRVAVDWQRDPPRLYCAPVPLSVDLWSL